jgi:nucleotide-binding universal stress UspA family protein
MIERLLVPIDGGALDERAFAVSIELARQLHAAIVGFIVEPFGAARAAGGLASEVSPTGTDAALQAHATGVLGRFAQLAAQAAVPFHGVATQSSEVSAAILDAAGKHRCDMIVMATHGRGVIAELLWGSHTREVMSRSELPVLVVH